MEKTFVMLKPDAVQRRLVGEIIHALERKGLKIAAMKMIRVDKKLAESHYDVHKGKEFFGDLIKFITSSPVVCMVIEGENAVAVVRKLVGKTNPQEAEPGSIRGDYGIYLTKNLIHASDSPETAKREISLFFTEKEILDYRMQDEAWLYKG